ncbi:hypothetical protein LCGC14_0470770 [marine sediment metagenome]|uniref:Uncharacterized protein n=1 Tax=marine sediment metagenome TaxID=412755 RepID=A0A0F9VL64_9ZZZZ
MAIAKSGAGRQIGDGNLDETLLGVQPAPQTATTTDTLTAAQILGGLLVGTAGTSAVNYTLPTVTLLEAALTNAVKVNGTFDFTIINLGTSSGIITIVVGTGWTLVGMVTIPITTNAGSSATFRARKTAAGAWTLYRIS